MSPAPIILEPAIGTPHTPLRLFFVRHGETEWSLSGQHTGRTDIPLTAHGEDEARQLGPCLQEIKFARVLTSPRQRAQKTCALAGFGPVATIEPDLAEWDYGDYEGQRSADIRTGRPGWNVFRDGCPYGETPTEIAGRADKFIAGLQAQQGNVALFSHGQFGAALAARWIGLPVIDGQHFPLKAASLSILAHSPGHPEVRAIELWNAVPGPLAGRLAP